MLNLDTHILIYLLDGNLNAREQQLIVQAPLAISDIVLLGACQAGSAWAHYA